MRFLLFITAALFLLPGGAIEGYGDHSLWVLVNDIKGDFKRDTGIPLELLPELAVGGTGCAKGILHAASGTPDRHFGLVCCGLRENTVKEYGLAVYPVAKEPLSIIVNAKNPVKGLTLKEVRDIFSGRLVNWKAVGGRDEPIVVVTRLHCKEHIPNWFQILSSPAKFKAKRVDVASEFAMAKTVSDFTQAVGHLEMTSVREFSGGIKVIPVDGYLPTSENLSGGLYPLSTTLSVVTKGEAGPLVMRFIEYLRKSPRVKKAMKKYGMRQVE